MIILATNIQNVKILLVGEFSRLHNSLQEGLQANGHQVILAANGDGFKNFRSDINFKATFFKSKIGTIFRKIWYKIFKIDLALLEHGVRFYFEIKKMQNFDIVQFINEVPIQTNRKLELFLLKKLIAQNKKVFLLCSGVDYVTVNHMLAKKERYSIMNPYFEGIAKAKQQYAFMFEYLSKSHKKIHDFLYKNCLGVIATDLDYVNPLVGNSKFLGMIGNPINVDIIKFKKLEIVDKIIIFLGINTGNSYKKGISFFEDALAIISKKYSTKVEIIITKDIPYEQYIQKFDGAHILLDQVYGYDQGYNALEAMAKGKVVFTGADVEFLNYYNLQEDEVAINALPDVDYLVRKLSFLIENPKKIIEIGINARLFVEKEHNYKAIANKYLDVWKR